MKQELDNLTTEESMGHSPEVLSPTARNNLSRLSLLNLRREEILKHNLQEFESKLVLFQEQKRMIQGTRKENSNIITYKIQKNKEDIIKIDKQLEKLEKNSTLMTNAIKKHNQQKVEAFKVALKPLQDVIDLIANSKSSLTNRMQEVDSKIENFSIIELQQLNELEKLYEQEQNFINHRKDSIKDLEELKKNNFWDYKEFIQDRETKELLVKVRDSKKQKVAELNNLDKIISDLYNQTQVLTRDIESLKNSSVSNTLLKKNESELVQLEEFLHLQCQNFGGPMLSEIIEELCILGNFPISQMIFKEQFRLIEQHELEVIEKAKHQQEIFENSIRDLTKTIEEQETELYALISVQQSDPQLEKNLKKSQKELEELREKSKKFNNSYSIKIEAIGKWKSDNRNILLITDTERIPTDTQVIEVFYNKLKPFIANPEHWKAMESVIVRYSEKSKERDSMNSSITAQMTEESQIIEEKLESLKKVRAIKTTKENERNLIHSEFEKILALEKKTLKELENSKLEVESARKSYLKEQLQLAIQANTSFSRIQKTYGEKAVKKLVDKETDAIKEKIERERLENKKRFEGLYEEKTKWDKEMEKISKEISEVIKPRLTEIRKELNNYKSEKSNLEKELQTLTEAEDEAHMKLDYLAEQKRNELVREAKKVANNHGGERSEKIDQLYELRNKKESEVIQLETEILKLEGGLTDKEMKADLEILRLTSKITNINEELAEILKSQTKANKLDKTLSRFESSVSDILEDYNTQSVKSEPESKKPVILNKNIEISEPPKFKSQSPSEIHIHDYITEEIKDVEEESTEKTPSHQPSIYQLKPEEEKEIIDECESDVSSEIPCPKEPQYKYDVGDAKNKVFFENVIPLIEGTIIYKLFKGKNLHPFDPIEGNIYKPEDCGFGIRKMKVNKQLSKIEIRQVGKAGVESSIIIDQIVSVIIPNITTEMIKARSKNLDESLNTLENAENFRKEYSNMKKTGNINFLSEAFIFKSKETCFFPFYLNTKGGRIEFVAEGLGIYKLWVQGIQLLIKNKPDLERLKFKIIST